MTVTSGILSLLPPLLVRISRPAPKANCSSGEPDQTDAQRYGQRRFRRPTRPEPTQTDSAPPAQNSHRRRPSQTDDSAPGPPPVGKIIYCTYQVWFPNRAGRRIQSAVELAASRELIEFDFQPSRAQLSSDEQRSTPIGSGDSIRPPDRIGSDPALVGSRVAPGLIGSKQPVSGCRPIGSSRQLESAREESIRIGPEGGDPDPAGRPASQPASRIN